jgi:8-amino-7-oxononanoate synthase
VNSVVPRRSLREAAAAELAALDSEGLRRRMRIANGPADPEIELDGARLLNFGSNNYLGLANHPEVVEASAAAARRFGTGSGSSRLITGNQAPVTELEEALAASWGVESALVFSSGYLANLGAIPVLAGEQDVLLSDRLNHASLIDAARLTRARRLVYPHADLARLDDLLAERRAEYGRALIVTDGLFSMDGDIAPLPGLLDVAERHDAVIYLDEAHATGVLGPHGQGTQDHYGIPPGDRVVRMGSLSKALGSAGGFVAGPAVLRDLLINRARAFIFDTGMPAPVAAAALAALRIAERESWRRERVRTISKRLRDGVVSLGFAASVGDTPVVPVVIGESDLTMRWMAALVARGCYAPGVRPPTVPAGEGRLRLSLMATHTNDHIDRLLEAMRAVQKELA